MKFLVDAQLPRRLAEWLQNSGHDARHTSDLPAGNRSTDLDVARVADDESRVVITKDSDFLVSHVRTGRPASVLIVATGNLGNPALLELFERHLSEIVNALADARVVELSRTGLSVREPAR